MRGVPRARTVRADGRQPLPLTRIRNAVAASPLAVDIAIAVGLTALSLSSYAGAAGSAGSITLALLLLENLPLIVRRRFPASCCS